MISYCVPKQRSALFALLTLHTMFGDDRNGPFTVSCSVLDAGLSSWTHPIHRIQWICRGTPSTDWTTVLFPDDKQLRLYTSAPPSQVGSSMTASSTCIVKLQKWCASRLVKHLNTSIGFQINAEYSKAMRLHVLRPKPDLSGFARERRLKLKDRALEINHYHQHCSTNLCRPWLGVLLDGELTMKSYVSRTVSTCDVMWTLTPWIN